MSMVFNSNIVHYDEFQPKNVKQCYQDVQRDPYKYLLTPTEKANAYGPIPRMVLGYGLGVLWAAYHLKRNNQLHRIFKLSGDVVIGFYWRMILGYVVGDRIGARLFCDYRLIWNHKAADYELRKLMRQIPDAKPFIREENKANSYFWL
mmetsp:Transcript_2474/g.2125  ORF Transcript_2474/g.2125 Transcript_2474/m.2125 type:complete len:148 (+) Transcript_2474:23-466(+)